MKIKYVQGWEVSKTPPTRTVGQLIRLFYKVHRYKDRGTWKSMAPITFLTNPAPWVMPGDPFAQDMYLAIYYGLRFAPLARYFITIEQNIFNVSYGPHVCKLFLQVYPGGKFEKSKVIWLAVMQIEGNFYNEKGIKVQLRRAIRLGEFYASEESQAEIVEFDEPIPVTYEV